MTFLSWLFGLAILAAGIYFMFYKPYKAKKKELETPLPKATFEDPYAIGQRGSKGRRPDHENYGK